MQAMMETKLPRDNPSKPQDAPSVYLLACSHAKAAAQLADLLETLNLCVQEEVCDENKVPPANGNIVNLMHSTADDLHRALRLAYALGNKLGVEEIRKPVANGPAACSESAYQTRPHRRAGTTS